MCPCVCVLAVRRNSGITGGKFLERSRVKKGDGKECISVRHISHVLFVVVIMLMGVCVMSDIVAPAVL